MSKMAVRIKGQRYDSALAAARELDVDYSVVLNRLKSEGYPDWTNVGPNDDPIIIDGVTYTSPMAAALALDVTLYHVNKRLKESGYRGWNSQLNGPFIKPKIEKKSTSKLKTGSKPVSICGVPYHTVTNACYFQLKNGGPVTRAPVLRRLTSTDPKWADWKYITEAELPGDIPMELTGSWTDKETQCGIDNDWSVVIDCEELGLRYLLVGKASIVGVAINELTRPGYYAVSFALNNGKYLCIKGPGIPEPGTDRFTGFKEVIERYITYKKI